MSAHMPRFLSFFRFIASFCIDQMRLRLINVFSINDIQINGLLWTTCVVLITPPSMQRTSDLKRKNNISYQMRNI